jgi:23S rRNA (uridine2552-2'-O)-methyltransferase
VAYERKDAHYRRAKAAGYRARSAYKLIELDDRYGILHPADLVVDLGAWPGAWLQVAGERVAPRGRVVGIDLVAVAPLGLPHVSSLVGDVRDPAAVDALAERLGDRAHVVLSDLAPKLTGVPEADEARAAELGSAALEVTGRVLRRGGRFVMKVFMNADFPRLIGRLRADFEQVKTTKPGATRRGSSEVYAIAFGYRSPCG